MTRGKKIALALEGEIITPEMVKFVERYARATMRGVENIIERGQILIEARAACTHGQWQVIVGQMRLSRSYAFMLMAVTEGMANVQHVEHFPPDGFTLYLLMRLAPRRLEELVADGTIHPNMKRQDASAAKRRERIEADEERVKNLAPVAGKFKTLIVDPPYDSDWYSKTAGHPPYLTMSIDDILALPVAAWAEGECHLYLWTPNNFLPLAVRAMAGWGFKHKSVLTWFKMTKDGSKPKNGRGHYFRNSTEQVLFGTRGKSRTRADDIPTHFESPVGAHSEKPEKFYEIVRRASHPSYGEAFQRKARKGFRDLFEVKGDG